MAQSGITYLHGKKEIHGATVFLTDHETIKYSQDGPRDPDEPPRPNDLLAIFMIEVNGKHWHTPGEAGTDRVFSEWVKFDDEGKGQTTKQDTHLDTVQGEFWGRFISDMADKTGIHFDQLREDFVKVFDELIGEHFTLDLLNQEGGTTL